MAIFLFSRLCYLVDNSVTIAYSIKTNPKCPEVLKEFFNVLCLPFPFASNDPKLKNTLHYLEYRKFLTFL
jgi:hypothetical protein